jgi:penicillin-binding protein 1C
MKKRRFLCGIAFIGAILLYSVTLFSGMDIFFPLSLPENEKNFAITVVAQDGMPLRTFPDKNGVWRYQVNSDDVSPLYIQALLNYEDRWFYRHPGINPLSMIRALGQYFRYRQPRSGGSTLTMQVARILHPHSKSIAGKLHQMFRAIQLEVHFSKKDILNLYLNYAPFGGPIEGVQAASFAYLGKSAKELSHAEAALLAVLPQSPTRLRPDRRPKSAATARNKVLDRMARFGVWDKEIVEDAKIEEVLARFDPKPMAAPLLAQRLKDQAKPFIPLRTTIDPFIQQTVADLIAGFIQNTPAHTSAAALVVENDTLAVKAYAGSADFADDSRFGQVDMVQAYRSPGSTLKPFLYAFAMEECLIHSESLLVDAPVSFSGYRPGNFALTFTGPVSAAEALQRSLNLPAVDILDRLGPAFFDVRLRQGGLNLKFPPQQKPNLTMILGGVGVTLEDLVSAYTAFGRGGLSGRLRYTPDDPLNERRMFSAGAAYIIRQILQEYRRPDLPGGRLSLDQSRQVAWKTGTSYGFRDAWTVGVTERHTIGVWVGRPDGTPSPGQYGAATAAPLLFSIVDSLPRSYAPSESVPNSVRRIEICWPLGIAPSGKDDPFCHQRRKALILNDTVPPTFPDRNDQHWQGNPINILLNPATGLRVDTDCAVSNPIAKTIARWPKAARPWLSPKIRAAERIPRMDPICNKPVSYIPDTIRISDIEPDTIFRPPGSETELPTITLHAQGGEGELFWMLNGEVICRSEINQPRLYRFKRSGRFTLTVMDLAGNYDSVDILVLGGNSE